MLIEPLFAHARATPQEIAVVDDIGPYSWQQIAAMASGLGMYLAQQTQRPHVGLLLPSSAGFVASFYGTLLAGKSVVPINFLLGEREIAHVIENSGIDTVVTIPLLAGKLAGGALKIVDLTQLPKTPPAIAPKLPQRAADDMAVLMYTSGTSGLPKGVVLTYGNLQSDVDGCIEAAALQKKHRFLGIIPLFHGFGMTATMLAPVQLGSQTVYQARFSPASAVEAVRKHQASIVFGVPSMFGAMLRVKDASAADFGHIYTVISGGEPLPAALRQAFPARFGVPIHEGYGLTETSPVVSLNTPQANRAGSVGRPLASVKVKIVDDQGCPVQRGSSGEVLLAGPMIMKGYYNLPAETAAALTADGYLRTGDLGMIDGDGYLFITGRKKELIIVAGEKVTPREVEDVLLSHPGVAEAAVIGRKDPTRGEAVVAFVVLRPEQPTRPEEIRAFCRDKGLPQFKVPRDVMVVEQLPRSPTGKVLKRVLAEKAEQSCKG